MCLQVSGTEGNFRCTCEKVMSVLRDYRDSLIAMLEAFVHDPLISWRLLGVSYIYIYSYIDMVHRDIVYI
jgi:FKBP12-rapamycin complex-associated protein